MQEENEVWAKWMKSLVKRRFQLTITIIFFIYFFIHNTCLVINDNIVHKIDESVKFHDLL